MEWEEVKFRVIDFQTGKEPDLEKIALEEEWADGLIYCDMEGFALDEEGNLLLMDECGKHRWCPDGRFKVEFIGDERKPANLTSSIDDVFISVMNKLDEE